MTKKQAVDLDKYQKHPRLLEKPMAFDASSI
jgi:hypothetical protein